MRIHDFFFWPHWGGCKVLYESADSRSSGQGRRNEKILGKLHSFFSFFTKTYKLT